MAGRDYRIEPDLLRAVSFRESSRRDNALNVVSQSEYAVGKMQIHSQNFSHLAQFGITPNNFILTVALTFTLALTTLPLLLNAGDTHGGL